MRSMPIAMPMKYVLAVGQVVKRKMPRAAETLDNILQLEKKSEERWLEKAA
jgi:hypothetical protein